MALLRKPSGRAGRPPKPLSQKIIVAVKSGATNTDGFKFVGIAAICEQIDLSKSQVLRLVKAGTFPKPLAASRKRRVWLKSEVINWMEEKVRDRENGAIGRELSPSIRVKDCYRHNGSFFASSVVVEHSGTAHRLEAERVFDGG